MLRIKKWHLEDSVTCVIDKVMYILYYYYCIIILCHYSIITLYYTNIIIMLLPIYAISNATDTSLNEEEAFHGFVTGGSQKQWWYLFPLHLFLLAVQGIAIEQPV